MPDTEYYYAMGSEQRGPIGAAALIALRLPPSTLVWREGMANWQHLDSVPELVEMMRPPTAQPTAPPPYQAPPHQAPPYQAPIQPPPPYAAPIGYTNAPPMDPSKRITAGIFGIVLGSLGIHKFILGYTGAGLIMCLVTIFTCGYAGLIFGPIGIAEGIIYLCTSDQDFYQRYVIGKRSWF
jgi:TM2 domain-containing membrane protein YozV